LEEEVPLAPPKLLRFSTEMLPERERMSAFREEFARQVLQMDVIALSDRPRIKITLLKVNQIGVGGLESTPSEFIRDAHYIKDGVDDFQLCLAGQGQIQAHHAGGDLAFDTGSACFFHYAQPYRAGSLIGGHSRNVAVPAAMLKPLVPHPEDRVFDVIHPGPTLHLLYGYLSSLLTLEVPPPPDIAQSIGLHLLDLVAAVIGPGAETREIIAGRGLRAARLRAVLAEIARHCGDPTLDVDHVANRLGISRRGVQRLLEGTGKSFTEHITERRLDRAHAMLSNPGLSHRRIIDIAFAAGFGDVSHFNRLFRRRFGETPSSARASTGPGGRA
jgi:AraC-like DNA-binding protein